MNRAWTPATANDASLRAHVSWRVELHATHWAEIEIGPGATAMALAEGIFLEQDGRRVAVSFSLTSATVTTACESAVARWLDFAQRCGLAHLETDDLRVQRVEPSDLSCQNRGTQFVRHDVVVPA